MLKVTHFPGVDVERSGEKNNMEIDMGENGRFLFDFMGYDETRRFLVKKMALRRKRKMMLHLAVNLWNCETH